MARLRVRDPDTLTRVTEYVPEIVTFVERIVQNGYAYEVDGSVYFDTETFDKTEGHDYAKLEPWSKGNRELLAEGEGEIYPEHAIPSIVDSHSQAHSLRKRVGGLPQILHCGRLRNLGSLLGLLLGAQDAQVGISNAPSWRVPFSATIWIYTRVVSIWHFLTTIMRWHRRRLAFAS
jgi:hypothetical protein